MVDEKLPKKEKPKDSKELENTDQITNLQNDFVDDKRLYVMNLSYTVTKEEL